MSTIINATEVTVRYNERAILDAATLAIDEGQRLGLVGRNGCGKTTFLKLLAGLLAPDSGTITRRRDLAVSYLSQDFTLDPRLMCAAMCTRVPSTCSISSRNLKRSRTTPNGMRAGGPHPGAGWLDGGSARGDAMAHLNCPPGERDIATLSAAKSVASRWRGRLFRGLIS